MFGHPNHDDYKTTIDTHLRYNDSQELVLTYVGMSAAEMVRSFAAGVSVDLPGYGGLTEDTAGSCGLYGVLEYLMRRNA